jgi:hypothetical protein
VSILISESAAEAVGGGRAPDAFLSSDDDLYWAEPRAVWVRRQVPAPGGGGDWLVLEIDPPVLGPAGETDILVAVPRHAGERLGTGTPVHVHVLLPYDSAAIDRPSLDSGDFKHAAWATLHPSWGEANAEYESSRKSDEATR